MAAASLPPLSPRGVTTALAAAVAAVAAGTRTGAANALPPPPLSPAPVTSAEAPAAFPPLALPEPERAEEEGSAGRRVRASHEAAAVRVARRAFEDARKATLAAIADGTHPLAERALRSSISVPPPSLLPPPLSSPPHFLDGDSLAALFEVPIARRREVLGRLLSNDSGGDSGALVAALALAATAGNRPMAAAALQAAADADAAAEVVWGALEGLL